MAITTLREGLLRVHALIQGGWIKGQSHKTRYGRDCYCLSGALDVVQEEGSRVPRLILGSAMVASIARLHPTFSGGIVSFNDTKGRTKAQVIAMLENAIQAAAL